MAEGFLDEDEKIEIGVKLLLELDSGSFALEMPDSSLELLVVALETPVSELELSVSVLELLVSVWDPAFSMLELLIVGSSVLELEFPCS